MINKDLDKVAVEDIASLIAYWVEEWKTIDYKVSYSLKTDKEKWDFLANVSSFANTSGWDLIFWIDEKEWKAEKMVWVFIENTDEEKLKIEHIIREWIEPRLKVEISFINTWEDKTYVIVIRNKKSYLWPHRVVYSWYGKTKHEFYSRNSWWKYLLDTWELRLHFNLSDTIIDKIKNFKDSRISSLLINETPIPFEKWPKIILHIVPIEAFSINPPLTNYSKDEINIKLKPLYCSWWNNKINMNWILTYQSWSKKDSTSYTQFYRKWIIEVVNSWILEYWDKEFHISAIEKELINYIKTCLKLLRENNISAPIFLFISFTDIKGFCIPENGFNFHFDGEKNIDDNIFLPEIYVENYDIEIEKLLKSTFDILWNCFWVSKSYNYDKNWNYKK